MDEERKEDEGAGGGAGRHSYFTGGFEPQKPLRAKSLSQARDLSAVGQSFSVQPGASTSSFFEGAGSHFARTTSTAWTQQVGAPSTKMSTKYTSLFESMDIKDLSRANKALVAGHSESLSPMKGVNTWKDKKTYSDAGQAAAALLRVNEATTAFGSESMGTQHDAGAGLMAEALHQKWKAKSQGGAVGNMPALLREMTTKFPQLDTVEKMRKAGAPALRQQIDTSRMNAAVSAGQRAMDKGLSGSHVGEYVQRKFAKHGLGAVPGGWAKMLAARKTP
jgi:hypothetical protein